MCRHHPAACGPLFCEQYFDEPAEQVVGARLGRPAHRRNIVEVGPFAAQESGAGAEILAVLPMFAWERGMHYGLVTVTRRLTLMLRRQRYTFEPLVDARPERLPPDQRERWGTYYDNDPQTGLIRLEHLAPVLAESAGGTGPSTCRSSGSTTKPGAQGREPAGRGRTGEQPCGGLSGFCCGATAMPH
ncbi:thermostable hemolysin [Micromonospora sp. M12]